MKEQIEKLIKKYKNINYNSSKWLDAELDKPTEQQDDVYLQSQIIRRLMCNKIIEDLEKLLKTKQ